VPVRVRLGFPQLERRHNLFACAYELGELVWPGPAALRVA
jgi:hypothetical protein